MHPTLNKIISLNLVLTPQVLQLLDFDSSSLNVVLQIIIEETSGFWSEDYIFINFEIVRL